MTAERGRDESAAFVVVHDPRHSTSVPWCGSVCNMVVLKKIVAMTLMVVVISAGAAAAAAVRPTDRAPSTSTAELDAFVQEQMERTDTPGAAYAVVGPEGVRHERAFGIDGNGEPVTSTTPFLWGSVAKPFAATLAVLLADDGVLDLDARVVDLLPDFRTAERSASDRITVRQLLDQTSGIPNLLGSTDRYEHDRQPADLVADLAGVELASDPGAKHVYSSLNYAVLAAVVEEVTGRSYADVLTERLLTPIGIDSALTGVQDESSLPPGHRYVAGRATAFTTQIDPAGTAYGYLGGDVEDLAAFAQASLAGGPLLTDPEREELTSPVVETGADSAYGLGWRTWQVPGSDEPMVWHSGAVPGYQASVVLLPERDEAIVVVQNAYGSFQEEPLLDTAWGLASIRVGVDPQL
ncbi:MAG: class A beta-lactamase-related serine hydrolase, partial [Actinomycetales bacterium]